MKVEPLTESVERAIATEASIGGSISSRHALMMLAELQRLRRRVGALDKVVAASRAYFIDEPAGPGLLMRRGLLRIAATEALADLERGDSEGAL
jgi:hypothetical protein